MYTLREVKKNNRKSVFNQSLGNQYHLVCADSQGYKNIRDQHFLGMGFTLEEADRMHNPFILHSGVGREIYLYNAREYYIMTENGATFENLSGFVDVDPLPLVGSNAKVDEEQIKLEIAGILHKDAGTMYDAKGSEDEGRIALDEDYFEDVAESVYCHLENMFSQKHRKESSGLKNTETKIGARKKAVTLENLLNYSDYGPRITENEYYNAMIEMKNLVLVLTNDVDLSRLEDK